MSILSRRAGSKLQGAVQGLAGSFGGLASIFGLIFGGLLYNSIGGATFLISAGVILRICFFSSSVTFPYCEQEDEKTKRIATTRHRQIRIVIYVQKIDRS